MESAGKINNGGPCLASVLLLMCSYSVAQSPMIRSKDSHPSVEQTINSPKFMLLDVCFTNFSEIAQAVNANGLINLMSCGKRPGNTLTQPIGQIIIEFKPRWSCGSSRHAQRLHRFEPCSRQTSKAGSSKTRRTRNQWRAKLLT